MSRPLPNPERSWQRRTGLQAVDRPERVRADLVERLGASVAHQPIELLSGGLANQNIRVGDRVVRIYRRDPGERRKEARLLQRGWTSFRVPVVHETGDDFLVLEYVAHAPVVGSIEHGAAVGRALAEIHAISFQHSGLLGPELTVGSPFGRDADDDVPVGEATFVELRDHVAGALDRDLVATAHQTIQDVVRVLDRLESDLRALASAPVLLHGDFKAANLHWAFNDQLLVLDWEFAYAGPAFMDLGQLIRWTPPARFCDAFAAAYRERGAALPDDWTRWAQTFDLINLAGMLATSQPDSRRSRDLEARIRDTVALVG